MLAVLINFDLLILYLVKCEALNYSDCALFRNVNSYLLMNTCLNQHKWSRRIMTIC